MQTMWRFWIGTALAAASVSSGCTTSRISGTRPLAQTLKGTIQPSAFSQASAAPDNQSLEAGKEAQNRGTLSKWPQQAAATSASAGGVVLASLKQAGSSLTQKLRIQPKVTPAADPVSLNNQPGNTKKVAADLHYHAGYFFETQKKWGDAAAHYRDALQTAPQDVRCLAGYGRVQDQLGNPTEAESYLRRACDVAPNDPAPRSDLAECLARRQNWEAAVACAREAVALEPANQTYRHRLAKHLIDAGRRDEAFVELAGPQGESLAHFQIGCLLHERHQTDLAKQHLQQSLELNPRLVAAQEMLDRWQHAASSPRNALKKRLPEPRPFAETQRLPVAD